MRVLQVCSGSPFIGGGTRIYAGNLSVALVKSGVVVDYYYPGRYDLLFRPYIKSRASGYGFKVYELRNKPISAYNFINPIMDIKCSIGEELFKRLLNKIRPDICHFHDMLNLNSGIIKVAKESGAKTLVTHNNYWFLCPNTYLFYKNENICLDPLSGKLCIECGKEFYPILRNIDEKSLTRRVKTNIKDIVPEKLIKKLKRFTHNSNKNNDYKAFNGNLYNFVSNNASEFAFRTKENIDILNHFVDINIAVSMDVKEILKRYGVFDKKILVNHIGIAVSDFVKPKNYDHSTLNSKTLVLGYLGPLIPQKGALKVIEALAKLSNPNIKFFIWGSGDFGYIENIQKYWEHVNFELLGSYNHSELNNIFKQIDIGIVPPIWHDNGPQVFYELQAAGIPCICSNVGGMKDFVEHGINGFLYDYNDTNQLAEIINYIYENKHIIYELAHNVKPPKGIREHTDEIIKLYSKLLNG